MKTSHRRRHVLTVTALLLLTGCKSAPHTPTAQATSDPTATLTAQATSDPTATPTVSASPATAPVVPAVAQGGTACSLVTEQDASTALGKDPGPGSAFTSHGGSQCQYGQYPLVLLANLTPSQGKAAFNLQQGGIARSGGVALTGLGDGAFGLFRGPLASVTFYKGDQLIVLVVTLGASKTSTPPRAQAIALATTVAGRL